MARVDLRVPDEELARWKAAAGGNLSKWIRTALNEYVAEATASAARREKIPQYRDFMGTEALSQPKESTSTLTPGKRTYEDFE